MQRTQTSHLPDPVDPAPVAQGIQVYFTHLVYGGVSFAILEDRKWKSAPRATVLWADIQNGWAQNPKYDAARDGDVPGAELLGPRQIKFLEQWAQDWRGAYLKIAVSQTILATIATLPAPANNDNVVPRLPLLKPGEYPAGEIAAADHDSNGWPQSPRNNALRAMRKAVAFHIGGDQHLGSTCQYGIDEFNDGPYALCSPAIANLFPRRWYPPVEGKNRRPGAPRNTGEFTEGFGNKVTIHAVANPVKFGVTPGVLYDRATGYSIVTIERATRQITMTNWPRWVDHTQPDPKPYEGWPITIHQFDNGLTAARFQLPRVDLHATPDAVVQIVREPGNEIVYTLRAQGASFSPKVWQPGTYTVRIIDPPGRTISHQLASPL